MGDQELKAKQLEQGYANLLERRKKRLMQSGDFVPFDPTKAEPPSLTAAEVAAKRDGTTATSVLWRDLHRMLNVDAKSCLSSVDVDDIVRGNKTLEDFQNHLSECGICKAITKLLTPDREDIAEFSRAVSGEFAVV